MKKRLLLFLALGLFTVSNIVVARPIPPDPPPYCPPHMPCLDY